ncbi:MAG: hypothetical protein NZ853_07860 [Leptospiraceae bacterium]|nr:hypothetical protein [Leptospiraceae bacterium]MDW7976913.1 hypothetical protein [Leptospiraceae bacterium]
MPILKGSEEVFILYKNQKIPCEILFETEKRISLRIPENPWIEKLKHEDRLDFETKQGNYDCFFQSKVEFLEMDILTKTYILEIDYPPSFRRILKQPENQT